jgi:hypothetical protein
MTASGRKIIAHQAAAATPPSTSWRAVLACYEAMRARENDAH